MDFKETCLWMSYRYAIGRKSIAAVSHAADIAKHLDWIPDDRWEFTAEDILREVNQSIGWTDNLTIMGLDGYRKTDVFSVLFSFIEILKSSVNLVKNLILCIESNLCPNVSLATIKCLIYALV